MKTSNRVPPVSRRAFIQSTAVAGAALATIGIPLPASAQSTTPQLPFRLATAGSYLAARIDATETTLLVATESGNRPWLHSGNFDLEVGNEVMGVTAIANIPGATSPQLFTVTRSGGLATAHPPGTSIQIVDTESL